MVKKVLRSLRDTLIAGIVFLIPVLIMLVLASKVLSFISHFTTKVATSLGLDRTLGEWAATLLGGLFLLIICLICGYLIRVALFKHFSEWADQKLMDVSPGYQHYRSLVYSKLGKTADDFPFDTPAWVTMGDGKAPGFIVDKRLEPDWLVFIPTAGKLSEGTLLRVNSTRINLCPKSEVNEFKVAISNLGIGMSFNQLS